MSKTIRRTAPAARRAAHFQAGGTIASWRGRARRIDNPKVVASRTACRRPIRIDEDD